MNKNSTLKNKKNRWKLIFIMIALVVAMAIIAVFSVYAFKHARRADQYRQAAAAFESGDYAKAEPLLQACIQADRNNEAAWEKLAKINEKWKRWIGAAECWHFLVGLSRLEERYLDSYVEALLRGQSYWELIRALEYSDIQKNHRASALALAHQMIGNDQESQKILSNIPSGTENERIRLTKLIAALKQSEEITESMISEEELLSNSSDDVVAFISESLKFMRSVNQQSLLNAEKNLIRMAEINPEASWSLLGDFYYRQARYEDAVRAYRAATQSYLSRESTLRYAESLFFIADKASLQKIAPAFQQGGRELILCGFYIEALIAYMDNDIDTLGQKIVPLGDFVTSPLVTIIRFDYALQSQNLVMLLDAVKDIYDSAELEDFLPIAFGKVQVLLQSYYTDGRIDEIAALSDWLHNKHRDNFLLSQIVLLNKAKSGTLLANELLTHLKMFPDDPVILAVAADYFNGKGEFASALQVSGQNVAGGNDSAYILLQKAHALEGLSRIAEARDNFVEARKIYPDDIVVLKRQIAFCLRNREPLPELNIATPEAMSLASLLAGEAALREGQTEEMIAQFSAPTLSNSLQANRDEDLSLLFYIALRLAEADALNPAIEIYEKIKPFVADPMLIHLNLSELYAAVGNKPAALKEAQSAWFSNSNNPAVKTCYGLRQWESGNFGEAIVALGAMVSLPNVDLRIAPAWLDASEKMIVEKFDSKSYQECLDFCKQLQRKYPDNLIAREYGLKAQKELSAAEELKLEQEKAKE